MQFFISLIINAVVFLCVYSFLKKWPILQMGVGILGFVIYLLKYQQFSGGVYAFAAAFDNSVALMKLWYFVLMLFWLAVAVQKGVKLLKGNAYEQILQSISRTLKTVTLPPNVDSEILSNNSITELIECGLGEEVIQEKIKHSRCSFALSTSDMANLKKNKVSDSLIASMIKAQSARGVALSNCIEKGTQPCNHEYIAASSSSHALRVEPNENCTNQYPVSKKSNVTPSNSALPTITPDPDPKTGRYVIS